MAISTYGYLSGQDQTLLREKGMLDSTFSNLKEMGKPLGLCKIPEDLTLFCGENVLRRCEVIWNKNDPIPMKNFFSPNLFERLDGKGRRDVIAKGEVDSDIEKVTREGPFFSCMGGKNLFRDRHRNILFHVLSTFGKKMKAEDEVKVEKY
jgi:hypothetical protein